MRVYSIEEKDYNELEEYLEKVVKCGKKLLKAMESGEFGSRNRHHDDWDEEDDYDWKIKRGNRY